MGVFNCSNSCISVLLPLFLCDMGPSVICHFAIPGPELITLVSCSTQLSMKSVMLINVKMPTIVGF